MYQPVRRGCDSVVALRKCESNLPMPQFPPMVKARTGNRSNPHFVEQEIRHREVVLESQPAQLSNVRDDIVRAVGQAALEPGRTQRRIECGSLSRVHRGEL